MAIAEENELTDPNAIEEGMELVIPDVTPESEQDPSPEEGEQLALATEEPTEEPDPTQTIGPSPEPEATLKPRPTSTPLQINVPGEDDTGEDVTITGETYTVERGDHLWGIAERAYGDPYQWVEIAQANDLSNPDIIHPGNTLVLPR